jgi:hypothetical protein
MSEKNQPNEKVPKTVPETEGQEPRNPQPIMQEGEDTPERDLDLGAIGSQLRGLYKELLEEPIPDRFTELLKDLESKETGKK